MNNMIFDDVSSVGPATTIAGQDEQNLLIPDGCIPVERFYFFSHHVYRNRLDLKQYLEDKNVVVEAIYFHVYASVPKEKCGFEVIGKCRVEEEPDPCHIIEVGAFDSCENVYFYRHEKENRIYAYKVEDGSRYTISDWPEEEIGILIIPQSFKLIKAFDGTIHRLSRKFFVREKHFDELCTRVETELLAQIRRSTAHGKVWVKIQEALLTDLFADILWSTFEKQVKDSRDFNKQVTHFRTLIQGKKNNNWHRKAFSSLSTRVNLIVNHGVHPMP